MKILHISDTHGQHESLEEQLIPADVIVHSGDACRHGNDSEAHEFIEWFASLDYKHKIFVPGNHDFPFEEFENESVFTESFNHQNMHLLINESIVIDGVKFWGSPYTPWFHDWAFQLYKHEQEKIWNKIDDDTDVLITHGPAYGVLDFVSYQYRRFNVGCQFLRKRIEELEIKAHLFGHIHEDYGIKDLGYMAVNSSVLDKRYKLTNEPQIIEIE